MARLVAFALATYCYLQPGLALAQDAAKQLAGSWKLNSWTIQIIGGEVTEPFGPNPKGRAVFTPDGYVAFVIVAANRKPAANNEEFGGPPQDAPCLHREIHNRWRQVYYQGGHIRE